MTGKKARSGRKPQGEFHQKSAVLCTRVREDTRKALEEAAARSKRSLSQETEARLVYSLEKAPNLKWKIIFDDK